jgi:hypothetical protein
MTATRPTPARSPRNSPAQPQRTPPHRTPSPQRTSPRPAQGAAPGPVFRGVKINGGRRGQLWTVALPVDNRPVLIFGPPVLSVLTSRLDSGGRRLPRSCQPLDRLQPDAQSRNPLGHSHLDPRSRRPATGTRFSRHGKGRTWNEYRGYGTANTLRDNESDSARTKTVEACRYVCGSLRTVAPAVDNRPASTFEQPVLSVLVTRLDSGGRRLPRSCQPLDRLQPDAQSRNPLGHACLDLREPHGRLQLRDHSQLDSEGRLPASGNQRLTTDAQVGR